MNYLIILNDPPYGAERSYNGLRLANSLGQRRRDESIGVPDGRCGVMSRRGSDYAQRLLQHRANA
jgi:hypothetical protein